MPVVPGVLGDYYRILPAGQYEVIVSADGYEPAARNVSHFVSFDLLQHKLDFFAFSVCGFSFAFGVCCCSAITNYFFPF